MPLTEARQLQRLKDRWEALFYKTPGAWYGNGPDEANPRQGYIVIDAKNAVAAIDFLRLHRVKITSTGWPIQFETHGKGGLAITFEF